MNIYETRTWHETFDQPCLFLDMNYEASLFSGQWRRDIGDLSSGNRPRNAGRNIHNPLKSETFWLLASCQASVYLSRKLKGHSSPRKRRNETVGCLLLYSHDTSLFVRYRIVREEPDPRIFAHRTRTTRHVLRNGSGRFWNRLGSSYGSIRTRIILCIRGIRDFFFFLPRAAHVKRTDTKLICDKFRPSVVTLFTITKIPSANFWLP